MDALRARLEGPPRRYRLDGEVMDLTGDWRPLVEHLLSEQWHLPLLLDLTHPEDAELLRGRIADPDDDLDVRDVRRISEGLVLAATGQRWWVVQRLVAYVAGRTADVDGDLLRDGVDVVELLERRPAAALHAVMSWLWRDADAKDRARLEADLFRAPLDLDDPEAEEEADERAGVAFLAAMEQSRQNGMIRHGTDMP